MPRQNIIRKTLLQLPLSLLLFGVFSASMIVPAIYGVSVREHEASRAFFYAGLLGLVTFCLIAVSHAGRAPGHGALGPLMSLFSAFVFLPIVLAIPFVEALPTTQFVNAYFEMVVTFFRSTTIKSSQSIKAWAGITVTPDATRIWMAFSNHS